MGRQPETRPRARWRLRLAAWGRLGERQRRLLAAKCADFGNIAAGSLIFGTLIREEALTVLSILLGVLLLVVAYVVSIVLSRRV